MKYLQLFLLLILATRATAQGSAQYPTAFPTDTSVALYTSTGNFGGWYLKSALGGGGGGFFSRTSGTIYPTTLSDRLGIGVNATQAAAVLFQVKGTTTDGTVSAVFENSVGTDIMSVMNNGRVGINRSPR